MTGGVLTNLSFGVERLIDVVGRLLSGSPRPVTDLLAGALWMVRTRLYPVGVDVGVWGCPPVWKPPRTAPAWT